MIGSCLALVLALLVAGAAPASADGLRLTSADLDAVLQDDTGGELHLPDSGEMGSVAPRRW